MKLELKNIKHSEFASQETHCYQASLYVDGKRVATVGNDGHGGCDYQHPVSKEAAAKLAHAIDWCKLNRRNKYDDLEGRCCDMVNDWLYTKDAKRILKKVCYINPDDNEIYSLPAKVKPTPETLEQVQQCKWWRDDFLLLNIMPQEGAIDLIIENIKSPEAEEYRDNYGEGDPDCDHPNIQYFPDEFDESGERTVKHHWQCPDCGWLQVG